MSYRTLMIIMANPKKKFAKTYDKLVDKIYRFIFLKVGSEHLAEDLTSQVFTKVWDRMRNPDAADNRKTNNKARRSEFNSDIKNLNAYIYQVARSEVAGYYRGQARFRLVSAENVQIADPQPDLETQQTAQAEIENLKIHLAQLNDDFENVIVWRYLDGLSYKEIAEIMEKPEGTVRVMVHRGLKELRQRMEG